MPKMIDPEVGTRAVRIGDTVNISVVVTSLTKTLIVTDDGERYRKSDHRNRSSSMTPYSISSDGEDDYPQHFRDAERAKWRRIARSAARRVLQDPDDPNALEDAASRFTALAARWREAQQ